MFNDQEFLKYEDFIVGEAKVLDASVELTSEDIIEFAQEFDRIPFHLSEEAGRKSFAGGLCASGWHSCALSMRLIYDGYLHRSESLGSPGVEELQWLKPVFPGKRLRLRGTCLEKRRSKSKPSIGLTKMRYELIDDQDDLLMQFVSHQMFGVRHYKDEP